MASHRESSPVLDGSIVVYTLIGYHRTMAKRGGGGSEGDWIVWGAILLALFMMGVGVDLNLSPDSWFKTGDDKYSREQFGPAWQDVDKNGCDTRNDILARDLHNTKVDSDGCTILSGTLEDPYTGKTIRFQRGKSTSTAVQIDHIIPLSYAWKNGANEWSAKTRLQFANDPDNLVAVDGPTNGAKSDKGPSDFVPPEKSYLCEYLGDFQTVAKKYSITIAKADQQFIEKQKC